MGRLGCAAPADPATAACCRRTEIPARHLLHSALLLIETGVFHPRRLHAAGEALR
jgi:hypothetical protein